MREVTFTGNINSISLKDGKLKLDIRADLEAVPASIEIIKNFSSEGELTFAIRAKQLDMTKD